MPQRSHEPVVGVDLGALRNLPVSDLLVRFGFGATISAVAGVISVLFGSEPGGILLAFPAILPATLTLIEKDEDEGQAEDLDVGSILGAAALASFAIVVWQFMEDSSASAVLALATATWLLTAAVLYLALRLTIVRRSPLQQAIAELRAGHHT